MGSGGPQGGFDMHNYFKTSSASSAPAYSHGYPPPSNAFSQNSYPAPSGTPSSGSFGFSSQSPGMYSYVHYPQEHMPRPPSYPSPPPYLPQTTSVPAPSVSSPSLDGARLMALLTTQSSSELRSKEEPASSLVSLPSTLELPPSVVTVDQTPSSSEASMPSPGNLAPSAPPVSLALPSSGTRSSKIPKGRHLGGERVVYDIDTPLPSEAHSQLEVSPITVYSSDPLLVTGRQIAVNRSYICYGLRAGTIRILNIHTASRYLLRGHTLRVTDMAFLADDVHTLASASADGRIYVRRIEEGQGDDGKNQITEQPLVAVQIQGEWESVQPRVCWWNFNTDVLIVGVGKHVLAIDTTKEKQLSPEDLIKWSVTGPAVDGIRLVGSHEKEVTSLTACPVLARFASSSRDGTVLIWEGQSFNTLSRISFLAPHAGGPVNSVAFLSSPRQPDNVVLLTADHLNKELKLYGADGHGWKCMQTLELKSSAEARPEDAFFNQLMVVPRASMILLANAKRNAIYVVHVEFGQQPQMDYLAEFSVRMPILSFTAISDNVAECDGIMQIYCVQTQAIQQYNLDLALCVPSAQEGKQEPLLPEAYPGSPVLKAPPAASSATVALDSVTGSAAQQKQKETSSVLRRERSADGDQLDKACLPDTSSSTEAKVDSLADVFSTEGSTKEEKDAKHQQHLVTPSELMSLAARATGLEPEAESKIASDNLDEERSTLKRTITENTESLLEGMEDVNAGDAETLIEEVPTTDDAEPVDERERTATMPVDDIAEQLKEVSSKGTDFSSTVSQSPAVSKGKKNKNKTSAVQASVASSSATLPEAESSASTVPAEGLAVQLQIMQESINQIMNMQKDFQKQMAAVVTPPITKETKRMEAALGQRLEKIMKVNTDAVAARMAEETAKRDKAERERVQQLTASIVNSINVVKEIPAAVKEVPVTVERAFKKELAGFGPVVAKMIEKAVLTALADAVQKSVSEKALPQIEKAASSKMETSLARQLQSQFQTTGRQALQDAMRSCFEGLVVPSFERSCRAMFEQVDAAFQKGMVEHTSHAQQQASASHTALASALQDTVATVTSLAVTMKSDLADGQRKLIALAESAGSRYPFPVKSSTGLPEKVLSLQHVEESLDPTIELSRLISQGKLEDAFNKALSLSDVTVVSWLCNQVDPSVVFSTNPPKLTQGVLLSLVQQLGCDLGKDTERKLAWIKSAALAINPNDPLLAPHMRPFLDQLYQNLHRQVPLASSQQEMNELRLVVHVVHSLLNTCK